MSIFNRTDKSLLSKWWWTVDRPILFGLIILVTIGVFLVSAASPSVAQRLDLNPFYFTIRHIVFLIPALFIMISMSFFNPRQIWRMGLCLLCASFVAMLLVLVTGDEIKGAKRWLSIFGFSIQPSEFAKPAFVIVAAWLMSLQSDSSLKFEGLHNYLICGLFYLTYLSLLALQPDIGMAFVITAVFGAQIFLAGLPLRWFTIFIGILLVGIVMAYMSFDHVQSRFDRFFNPEQGDTYQVEKSLEAFQNGGFLGTGPGQGTVKLQLPDSHADFIFSVAAEELGFFFVFGLIGLYGFIVLRGFNKCMGSDDLFIILAVGGLLIQFALQTFIHMGSSANILPTKGMTLPFISYGGSSLLSIAFTMGAVLALTRRHHNSG